MFQNYRRRAASAPAGYHDGGDAHLVDHVALRMPMFVNRIAVDLDELLEDGGSATGALDCEACRVVKVAVD